MSIQAVGAILKVYIPEAPAKLLAIALANAHNEETGRCDPSVKRLAAETSMSPRTVHRWLAWLAGRDARQPRRLITIEVVYDGAGRQRPSAYKLNFDELARMKRPETGGDSLAPPSADPMFAGDDIIAVSAPADMPLKKPESSSPQPPSGGLKLDELWNKWPQAQRGNRENVEGTWKRLPEAEQLAATRAADLTISALPRRKQRVPALATYLRAKLYLEFDDAPPVDIDGYFVIRPGRPEWSAWLGAVRKQFDEAGVQSCVKTGYMLRTSRWPEDHICDDKPGWTASFPSARLLARLELEPEEPAN